MPLYLAEVTIAGVVETAYVEAQDMRTASIIADEQVDRRGARSITIDLIRRLTDSPVLRALTSPKPPPPVGA